MNEVEKMAMKTADGTVANIAALKNLFPEIVTEGKVDFEALKTILGGEVAGDERYQFTWAGKRAAMIEAAKPITKTLRPCPEQSKNWDSTQNLYIEGDNLDALKILQATYAGKVKMIYIDPPYNTGKDFIYHDNFHGTKQEELIKEGAVDAETGERFKANTESNGYFHSDWCSMMYPRLKLARQLLREDGVIFISIDDGEITNQRRLLDEVFGENNFIAQIVWQKIHSIKNDAQYLSDNHEYVLMYAKLKGAYNVRLLPRTQEMNDRYKNPDNDPRGPWQSGDLVASGERANGHYIVTSPSTGKQFDVPKDKHWVYSETNLQALVADNQVWFGADGNAFPRKKRFLSDVQDGRTPSTLWLCEEVGHNQSAARDLKALFDDKKIFDFPKPIELVKQMLQISSSRDDVCVDFFSGSAVTAHAVMQLNAEDGGKRKFILVQLPEVCAEGSEAAKAGYKNICEIGKERIRRAGEKIKEEVRRKNEEVKSEADLFAAHGGALGDRALPDVGFRVFKVDSSNMEDIYYAPKDVQQADLLDVVNNVKPDRKPIDLLYGCLVDWGLPIDLPHETKMINGHEVFSVGGGVLMACFDQNVDDATVKAIAAEKPSHALFRDTSFVSSAAKINVGEIFKALSPETKVRVL